MLDILIVYYCWIDGEFYFKMKIARNLDDGQILF